MRFIVPKLDLRSHGIGSDAIEDESGNVVGQFRHRTSSTNPGHNRTVILLGKYIGQYETHAESQAFADGVAEVLTHMTKMEYK